MIKVTEGLTGKLTDATDLDRQLWDANDLPSGRPAQIYEGKRFTVIVSTEEGVGDDSDVIVVYASDDLGEEGYAFGTKEFGLHDEKKALLLGSKIAEMADNTEIDHKQMNKMFRLS